MIRNGLIYINDILKEDGDLIGYEDFKSIYNVYVNFMDFYNLIHSIPRIWRMGFHQKLPNKLVHQNVLETLIRFPKVCRAIYPKMLNTIEINRGHEAKWNSILQKDIDEMIWSNSYGSIFKCTIDSRMRSFQYSILLRTLPTNKYLRRCGLVQNDLCYYCKVNSETPYFTYL